MVLWEVVTVFELINIYRNTCHTVLSCLPFEILCFLLEFVVNEGFKLYQINPSGSKRLSKTSVDELLKKFTPEKDNGTNLYCTREELNLGN